MSGERQRGFSIRIFMPDGEPDGLRIVEKSNWTGRGVVCPRSLYSSAKSREEFLKAGVYVLTGPSDDGDLPRVYIGEAESVRPRLDQHVANKDFWTAATFFVSKDENLNKAHVQYLESQLVQRARAAKRCELENANEPKAAKLSEADVADVEGFLEEMLLCLAAIGLDVFESPPKRTRRQREFFLRGKKAEARGYEAAAGFVVLQGARARRDEVPSMDPTASRVRKRLREQGVLVEVDGQFELAQDYEFGSPSQAAAVFLGRGANGRVEWKDAAGLTLKEIQEAEAAA